MRITTQGEYAMRVLVRLADVQKMVEGTDEMKKGDE